MSTERTKKIHTPKIKLLEREPIARTTKDGIILMCPFCKPTHVLRPTEPSVCGTRLSVTAVQEVISARSARILELVCLKCGKKGGGQEGEMVKHKNGFLHVRDCAPKTALLSETPKFSRFAKFVYHLPRSFRFSLEKRLGIVQIVKEITPEGEETGKVLGYFFGRKAKHG